MRLLIVFAFFLSSSLFFNLETVQAAPQAAAQAAKPNARSYELNEKGVQAVNAKDFVKAEDLFRQALLNDKGNITAAFNLGGIYLTNKKETLAVKLLEEYSKAYPTDAGLWVRLGDAYFATKDIAKAGKAYEAAFTKEQKYAGLAAKLATVYGLSNNLKQAEKMLLIAVEEDPKNAQLLSNLSSVFLANGKADMSISTAKRGLQVKASSDLYVTLGNAYEIKKDYKNSLISFQRALDLGNSKPELKNKIEELKKMVS